MRLLVAPDSFKGTMSAREVAQAIAGGARAAGAQVDPCPVADGGEGTLEILCTALSGELRTLEVAGPLGDPVRASFALLANREAIVEMAQASGLGLVAEAQRDAEAASTRGTGELIAAAVAAGAERILVTVGGSGTTDGGAGAIAAIEAAGGLCGARIVVLCDTTTPFERAAEVFAPQKGADAAAVERLARRLDALAGTFPRDPRGVPMTGGAGGLSGGLWAALDAELAVGADAVLDALSFDARLDAADAVVVGEGRLDAQSLDGKIVGAIARRAGAAGVPVHAIVGQAALTAEQAAALGLASVTEAGTPAALTTAGAGLARSLVAAARA
jgi:glycerate kinase